jgi:hypothetical protein
VLGIALILAALFPGVVAATGSLVAFALFVTAIIPASPPSPTTTTSRT